MHLLLYNVPLKKEIRIKQQIAFLDLDQGRRKDAVESSQG